MNDRANIEENYMKERWENQVIWLDKKSTIYKKRYQYCKFAEIIFAALIPFLAVLDETEIGARFHINLFVAALGVALTIIAGVLLLYKFHELWIQYRSTAEALKVEKFLFDTKTGDYSGAEPFRVFVAKVESILANENAKWTELIEHEVEVQKASPLEQVE